MSEQLKEKLLAAAEKMGAKMGESAATWYPVQSEETARAVLKGIDDGDPMVLDTFPSLWAGIAADEVSVDSLLADVVYEAEALDPIAANSELADELMQEIDLAFSTAAQDTIERTARIHAGVED